MLTSSHQPTTFPPYRSRCLTSTNKRGMSDARRFQQQTRSSRLLASPEKNPGVSHPLGTLVALKAVSRGDARMLEQLGWELLCGMDRYFLRLADVWIFSKLHQVKLGPRVLS